VAIGVLFEFPGVSGQQYDEACRRLNNGRPLSSLADWPEPGIVAHVAGPTPDGGWRVVDVWESEEAFGRFGQQLVPVLEQVGIPAVAPQIFPVHNVVTQRPKRVRGGALARRLMAQERPRGSSWVLPGLLRRPTGPRGASS